MKVGYLVLCFVALSLAAKNCSLVANKLVPYATVPEGFCAFKYATGLNRPRSIQFASNGDLLVVEQGNNQITVLWDDKRAILVRGHGVNHGLAIHDEFLYASNSTAVWRWKYTAGVRSDLGSGELVIRNIPCCHHVTRTILFDNKGLLYVQVGSEENVAPNSLHARINRFSVANIPAGGIEWTTGEVFADGVRNEVGLRFDSQGRLWGVENGVDELFRADLGGDIHENNPSEEMNLFAEAGKFYGYPYCWSQYDLRQNQSHPRGTQWVHENFMNDGVHSDSWCREPQNVVVPKYNFGAHMAPMDIHFTRHNVFPQKYNGAFVSFHGSWDRDPPSGYRVDHVELDSNGMPISNAPFFQFSQGSTGSNWPYRPVGLAEGKCQIGYCLFIASDKNGEIVAVGY